MNNDNSFFSADGKLHICLHIVITPSKTNFTLIVKKFLIHAADTEEAMDIE